MTARDLDQSPPLKKSRRAAEVNQKIEIATIDIKTITKRLHHINPNIVIVVMTEAIMTTIKALIPEGIALAPDTVTHTMLIARIIIIIKARMITMSEEKEIMIMIMIKIKITGKVEEEAEVKTPDLKIKEVALNQVVDILVIVKDTVQLEETVIDRQVVIEKPH